MVSTIFVTNLQLQIYIRINQYFISQESRKQSLLHLQSPYNALKFEITINGAMPAQ